MAEFEIRFVGDKRDLNQLVMDLFESDSFRAGLRKELPGGGVITLKPMEMRKGVAGPHAVEILLNAGLGVVTSLIAAYLYDKLRTHKDLGTRLFIDRREIHATKSEITKIIEE